MFTSDKESLHPIFASEMDMYLPNPLPAPVMKTCSPLSDFFGSHPICLNQAYNTENTNREIRTYFDDIPIANFMNLENLLESLKFFFNLLI